MKKLCFLFWGIFFFFSCSEEQADAVLTEGEMLLSSLLVGGKEYHVYVYDDEGRILEERSKFFYTRYSYEGDRLSHSDHYVDESIFSSSFFTKDREEWVNPENTEMYSCMKYDYDPKGNLLTCCNYLGCSNFEYDSSGRISRRIFYNEAKISGFQDYRYDQSGNLEVQRQYIVTEDGENVLQYLLRYEYDNMNNPYQAMSELLLPGKFTNPNNVIREIYIHYADSKEEVKITEHSYIYNKYHFPVLRDDNLQYVYEKEKLR